MSTASSLSSNIQQESKQTYLACSIIFLFFSYNIKKFRSFWTQRKHKRLGMLTSVGYSSDLLHCHVVDSQYTDLLKNY